MNNPIVTIEMENGKKITAELYPDIAPQSVRNFISLANSGFYNGLIFHRCIYGFMIQGGCPDGTGMGGPGYCIKGEFAANGVPNDLRHTRGVLSMARAQDMDSAGSQFFIMHKDAPHLDGQYAGPLPQVKMFSRYPGRFPGPDASYPIYGAVPVSTGVWRQDKRAAAPDRLKTGNFKIN